MKEYDNNLKKRHFRSRVAALFTLLIGFFVMNGSLVVSAANRVPKMEIDVALQSDGSAKITQIWTADTDEGTEFYLVCRDNGIFTITDFSVADELGAYTFQENWDVGASFEGKAYQCGIVETDEGVELCWGISEYGEKRYTLEYVVHDLVGSYTDADGFHYRFVDEMSFFPTDVVLTIRNQDGSLLTDDVCDIWGFGYDGQIIFEDGVIRAWSEDLLESGHHMTIMVSLEKGILSPMRTVDDSFENVKERAFEGSDYGMEDTWEDMEDEEVTGLDILVTVLFFGVIGAFVTLVIMAVTKLRKARMNKRMKAVEYFRDAPNNGNLNVTYELGKSCGLCKEDALLGAYMLRLISEGCLEVEAEDDNPKKVKLRLICQPYQSDLYEDIFYTVLEAAAGEDGVLQPDELERYSYKNVQPLRKFMDSCVREAKQTLIHTGCFKGAVCNGTKDLTKKGRQQLDEILGLKRFLLDFSLIHEREVKETVIWQDYMIYAFLLGIADKVAPQIRELYPEALPQIQHFERCVVYTGYYNTILYRAYREDRYRYEASRSMGSGGYVSIGGGGGFTGGGGGGTR